MEGLERTKKGPEYEVKYSALWSCGVLLFHSVAEACFAPGSGTPATPILIPKGKK
jgi:hypothetical protein